LSVPSPSAAALPAAESAAAEAPAAALPAAEREARQTTLLVVGALLLGGGLQIFISPGPLALVVGASTAAALVLALALALPGRWRETLAGFRYTSTLLVVLSGAAILGTLILQNKPMAYYESRYGAVGSLVVALRLDDIFHSLWFAGFIGMFLAGVVSSATLRWPVRLKSAGFFTCHLGLLTCLAGAGASAALSVKGRVDLHAGGETATRVAVTRAGLPTGELVPLGFDLRLDRFDLVRYTPEYRVAYYRLVDDGARLEASFDPEEGVKHRLPSGDSFRLKKLVADVADPSAGALRNPAAVLEVTADGLTRESPPLLAARQDFVRTRNGVLVFERREDEVKAFLSQVTATSGNVATQARVSVNDPFSYGGWTFYQVNYDPKDPTYSGLEAVRDPGVSWVFLGFALISLGVFAMFYLEPRWKRAPAAARAS